MAEYDLTSKIVQFLDPHLMLPLIDFISSKGIFPQEQMLNAKIQLLQKTNMVDYLIDVYKQANNGAEPPPALGTQAKREDNVATVRKLQDAVKVFTDTFSKEEGYAKVNKLSAEGNFKLDHLEKEYKITEKTLSNIFHYAKFQFDCGTYPQAAELLYYYRVLSASREHDTPAMWGKLAAEILSVNWDTALEDLKILRDSIDNNPNSSLQTRVWFIHWALFVYFNHPDGRDAIIELFFETDRYLSALQTSCPHILRYVTAALITNRKKRPQYLKTLIAVIEQESYSDPITELIEALYIEYDFEAAQTMLEKCKTVLANDFFLTGSQDDFIENARLMIFENYCRIHTVIDIGMVAEKLGMDKEKAEIWIVNLIRQAHLDATIDSQANQVIMDSNCTDVYQHVKEKAKNLTLRTFVLWKQAGQLA